MGAEVIASSDKFDASFTLHSKPRMLNSGQSITLELFTDRKTLFNVILKSTQTSKKRLMLDIMCAKERIKKEEIGSLSFITFDQNLADGMTRQMRQTKLQTILPTGIVYIEANQWTMHDGQNRKPQFSQRRGASTAAINTVH